MKGYLKLVQGIISVAGAIVYGVGLSLFFPYTWIPFLMTFAAVPLVENYFVADIIQECREQNRFAWNNRNVRTDLYCMLGTLIFLWIVQFFVLRAKYGSYPFL